MILILINRSSDLESKAINKIKKKDFSVTLTVSKSEVSRKPKEKLARETGKLGRKGTGN